MILPHGCSVLLEPMDGTSLMQRPGPQSATSSNLPHVTDTVENGTSIEPWCNTQLTDDRLQSVGTSFGLWEEPIGMRYFVIAGRTQAHLVQAVRESWPEFSRWNLKVHIVTPQPHVVPSSLHVIAEFYHGQPHQQVCAVLEEVLHFQRGYPRLFRQAVFHGRHSHFEHLIGDPAELGSPSLNEVSVRVRGSLISAGEATTLNNGDLVQVHSLAHSADQVFADALPTLTGLPSFIQNTHRHLLRPVLHPIPWRFFCLSPTGEDLGVRDFIPDLTLHGSGHHVIQVARTTWHEADFDSIVHLDSWHIDDSAMYFVAYTDIPNHVPVIAQIYIAPPDRNFQLGLMQPILLPPDFQLTDLWTALDLEWIAAELSTVTDPHHVIIAPGTFVPLQVVLPGGIDAFRARRAQNPGQDNGDHLTLIQTMTRTRDKLPFSDITNLPKEEKWLQTDIMDTSDVTNLMQRCIKPSAAPEVIPTTGHFFCLHAPRHTQPLTEGRNIPDQLADNWPFNRASAAEIVHVFEVFAPPTTIAPTPSHRVYLLQLPDDHFDQVHEDDVLILISIKLLNPDSWDHEKERIKASWGPKKATRSEFMRFLRANWFCNLPSVLCSRSFNGIQWPYLDDAIRHFDSGDHVRLVIRSTSIGWCDLEYSESTERKRKLYESSSPEEPQRGEPEEDEHEDGHEESEESEPRSRSRSRSRGHVLLQQRHWISGKMNQQQGDITEGLPTSLPPAGSKPHVSDRWCVYQSGVEEVLEIPRVNNMSQTLLLQDLLPDTVAVSVLRHPDLQSIPDTIEVCRNYTRDDIVQHFGNYGFYPGEFDFVHDPELDALIVFPLDLYIKENGMTP